MGISLTVTAFLFATLFSGIAIYEKILRKGKLSMGTKISVTIFCLMLCTGIANDMAKDNEAHEDKQELLDKIDSTAGVIDRKIDSIITTRPKPASGRSSVN